MNIRLFLNKKPQIEHESGSLESCKSKVTKMTRIQYVPCLWKIVNIILLSKPMKPTWKLLLKIALCRHHEDIRVTPVGLYSAPGG